MQSNTPAAPPMLHTLREAAKLLRRTERAVYDLRQRGEIGFVQDTPGGRVYIPRAEIDRYIARNTRRMTEGGAR